MKLWGWVSTYVSIERGAVVWEGVNLSVAGSRIRVPLQCQEAPGKPGVMAVRRPGVELLDESELVPILLCHPLPDRGGEVVQLDV